MAILPLCSTENTHLVLFDGSRVHRKQPVKTPDCVSLLTTATGEDFNLKRSHSTKQHLTHRVTDAQDLKTNSHVSVSNVRQERHDLTKQKALLPQ